MSIATLLQPALKISLVLIVFTVGLRASLPDVLYLFRRPGQLARALLSMDVIVPVAAAALAIGLALPPPVKIALVTIALAPLPPVFSKKQLKKGGTISYTVGLFVSVTLIAVVFIPFALRILERVTGIPLEMSSDAVWKLVVWSLLVPLIVGVVVHQLAPALADRVVKPLAVVTDIVLIIAVIAILIRVWPAMWSLVGDGTVLVMVILAAIGFTAGHLLGGPDPEDRQVLAHASGTRHPGIAIAIATANFPKEKLAPAAVLLYLLVSLIVSVVYLKLVAKRRAAPVGGQVSPGSTGPTPAAPPAAPDSERY